MAHINVQPGIPGIRSLVLFRPESGKLLYALAQELLRGESPIAPADRELIAAYVSHLNNCMFCSASHAAAARCLYGTERFIVDEVLANMQHSGASELLKALLHIAAQVQLSGKSVSIADVDAARALGATDKMIHGTVLIAAAFCMFNRYVDGLASFTPTDPEVYAEMGERMVNAGYTTPVAPSHHSNHQDVPVTGTRN